GGDRQQRAAHRDPVEQRAALDGGDDPDADAGDEPDDRRAGRERDRGRQPVEYLLLHRLLVLEAVAEVRTVPAEAEPALRVDLEGDQALHGVAVLSRAR